MADRTDLPQIDDFTQEWWDAAADNRLLIRRCNACGAAHYYPRPFCPTCWSEDGVWEQASGRATLYTWSVVFMNDLPPFKERLPYIAAVVDLEEGPRMMTTLVDCEADSLVVGMACEVTFRKDDDPSAVTVPVFRPAP